MCKKTFVNTWNLNRHTKKDHGLTEIGNVVKNSVGMAVFTTEALVKEKVSKPTHEKQPLQCDQCDYKSLKRNNLTRHMTKHDGIKKPETRGRKKRMGFSQIEPNAGERWRMETTRQRERFLGLERV